MTTARREENITDAVIESLANSPLPRTKQIGASLVRHLHGLRAGCLATQAEWEQATEFLTRTGQMCTSTRREFILLPDALGVSMLVDAINHRFPGLRLRLQCWGRSMCRMPTRCLRAQASLFGVKGRLC